eukprot:6189704-Pleurochrysis_carterae.AAC.1
MRADGQEPGWPLAQVIRSIWSQREIGEREEAAGIFGRCGEICRNACLSMSLCVVRVPVCVVQVEH